TLIEAEVELWRGGTLLDRVTSYTALRSVAVRGDQFLLNGRPYYLRLALDQGYWPDSLMTPPDDDALRRDVELAKAMGFNGVRKHQKIEDPRFLYWADRLGLLVWEEMPSAYRFTEKAVERITREWAAVIERDINHPCIVVWVPFNESWGVPDLAEKEAHRHYVRALYHLTKTLDPTRPCIGNDGWENAATDILTIHDYDPRPEGLAARYGANVAVADLLGGLLPAGRRLTVEGFTHADQPLMLTEFGGIALAEADAPGADEAWGYAIARDAEELFAKVADLLAAVHRVPLFRGFCYTQFTDVFQEANGLLTMDRRPKVPLDLLASVVKGPFEERPEVLWAAAQRGEGLGAEPAA
ncbi:MAG TPA: glycoside hydrolase family 2 TIM barrel-domain containing protein, partial [Rubricoccaceae bacterium]|nr:glycoside hydrolase family 2 TIM barrel-domain containing protein [Rubricoccaceae bacterium]